MRSNREIEVDKLKVGSWTNQNSNFRAHSLNAKNSKKKLKLDSKHNLQMWRSWNRKILNRNFFLLKKLDFFHNNLYLYLYFKNIIFIYFYVFLYFLFYFFIFLYILIFFSSHFNVVFSYLDLDIYNEYIVCIYDCVAKKKMSTSPTVMLNSAAYTHTV